MRRNCVKRIKQCWIQEKKWKQTRSKYLFNELNNWLSRKCHFPSPGWFTAVTSKGRTSPLFMIFISFLYTFRDDTVEGCGRWLSRCEMMITSAIVCWSFAAQLDRSLTFLCVVLSHISIDPQSDAIAFSNLAKNCNPFFYISQKNFSLHLFTLKSSNSLLWTINPIFHLWWFQKDFNINMCSLRR